MIGRRKILFFSLAGTFPSLTPLRSGFADSKSMKSFVRPDDSITQPNKDYRMVISLPAREFVNQPLMLTYEFQNHSEKPIVFYQGDFGCNHAIVLKDANGNEPTLTKRGRYLKERFKNGLVRDQNLPVNVLPGKTSQATIDLAQYYELNPGRYRVKVLFREYANKDIKAITRESMLIEIESNGLEFEIK